MDLTREQVLGYRLRAQQLDRIPGERFDDTALLDIGVQDTGPDGAAWALALRGVTFDPTRHFLAWTLRGAPNAYRRTDAAAVATATAPYDEADATKRVFDASKPLKEAGIAVLDALDTIANHLHDIVSEPTVKGDMSSQLTERVSEPYLRYCRSCDAIHCYEQPFRLSALQAGLELEPRTSPPVLRPTKNWSGPAMAAAARLDPIRSCLHLFGPQTLKQIAEFIDAPLKVVRTHLPEDARAVAVDGESRWVLADDLAALADPPREAGVRLLGPFDLFLQARDRELVVSEARRRKDLWRTLGRPGAVLSGFEIVGTWRPRAAGKRLSIVIDRWEDIDDTALEMAAERLAEFRGAEFGGFKEP